MARVEVFALVALLPWGAGPAQDAEAPRRLHVVAEIDGVDELHLNATEARWIHHAWQMPRSVSINGREWDPRERQHWVVGESEPFLDQALDLAGATVTLVRGRGEIGFRHGGDRLVITFDDGSGGVRRLDPVLNAGRPAAQTVDEGIDAWCAP